MIKLAEHNYYQELIEQRDDLKQQRQDDITV